MGGSIDDLTVAGKMLSPLMGNAATVVFALALLLAGISSSITAGMAGGTIFSGIFNQPYDTKTKETKAGILLTMILAAVVILFISQPFKGLIYSQMLLAIQLPITIFTQIYLTSSEKVMGKYVNSRRFEFFASGDCCDCNRAEYSIVFLYRQEEQNKKKEKPGTV